MCCFTQRVKSVSATRIFARPAPRGGQLLVYSMTFSAAGELAMVLPLPVAPGAGEDAVRFINLEKYDAFFSDMQRGFPEDPPFLEATLSMDLPPVAASILKVHDVGSFEASFVPTFADFARLDPRFRLPEQAWSALPQQRTYGFAVFKLKQHAGTVHPMAFEFPRRDPDQLFFPTLHIHDGRVHATARFDHLLYCQEQPDTRLDVRDKSWQVSRGPAGEFMTIAATAGIVDGARPCFRRRLDGSLPNQDTLVRAAHEGPDAGFYPNYL
jgi:hypothetical protein